MKTERYLPADRLKPFVKAFMLIESEQGMVNKLLPSTSIVMAFRYKGNVRYTEGVNEGPMPTAVITGLRNSMRLVDYTPETATLLVIFNEGGAAALFKESLHELFGSSATLDELMPRQAVSEVEERLAEAKTNQQRLTIVEQFLLSRLQETSTDLLVQRAIQQIQLSSGTVRINELLANLPISQDPFEKRFRRVVGTSPKQFSKIVRLRSVINQYSSEQSLTNMAHQAGYFDQAHFIKDFRSFTGQAPHLFFQSGGYW